MKHTIKLGGMKSIVFVQDGDNVSMEIRVGGVPVHTEYTTPETLTLIANAAGYAAMDAQAVRAKRAEAVRTGNGA